MKMFNLKLVAGILLILFSASTFAVDLSMPGAFLREDVGLEGIEKAISNESFPPVERARVAAIGFGNKCLNLPEIIISGADIDISRDFHQVSNNIWSLSTPCGEIHITFENKLIFTFKPKYVPHYGDMVEFTLNRYGSTTGPFMLSPWEEAVLHDKYSHSSKLD